MEHNNKVLAEVLFSPHEEKQTINNMIDDLKIPTCLGSLGPTTINFLIYENK